MSAIVPLVAKPWPTLPTVDQCQRIGQLRTGLARVCGPTVVLDATPVPEVSMTPCRDWSHGPAVVRLRTGALLCVACAVEVVEAPLGWQTSAVVPVEVLRAPSWDGHPGVVDEPLSPVVAGRVP